MEADVPYQTAHPDKYARRYIAGDPISIVDDGVLYDEVADEWLVEITMPHCIALHIHDLTLAEGQTYLAEYRSGEIILARRVYNVTINNLPVPLRTEIETFRRTDIIYDLFASQLVDKSA
jgi:hypothetical protein